MIKRFSRKKAGRKSRFNAKNPGPQSFSYYGGSPSTPQPAKPQKSRLRKFITHLPSYAATIVIIISLGYSLSLNPDLSVNIVRDSSTPSLIRDTSEYYAYAHNLLSDSILNKTKVTVDTGKLESKLLAQFPEIEKAQISLSISRHRPILTLRPATLSLLYTTSSSRFALDLQGKAVLGEEEISRAATLDLPVVQDKSGLEANRGKQLLTEEEVSFITELTTQLKAANLEVESLTLPKLPSELHLRVKGTPYFVKFSLRSHSREAVGTFLAVRAKLTAEGTTPKEYIDVRIEEKAYYR